MEDKLSHDSFYDSLTQLPNRNYLITYLANLIQVELATDNVGSTVGDATPSELIAAMRAPEERAGVASDSGVTPTANSTGDGTAKTSKPPIHPFMFEVAIFYLDIDGFKNVNDTKGRDTGDRVLQLLANRLKSHVCPDDIVSRYDNDEFVIMAHHIPDPKTATAYANRILRSFDTPFSHDNLDVFLSAHIGIATIDSNDRDEESIDRAAVALHNAKKHNNGRVAVFTDELAARIRDRIAIEYDLRNAVREHQFFLHYQPIVSLSTREVVGFEALVRWNHPERGIVPPLTFIPLAEDSGYIADIGRWVLEEACLQIASWHRTATKASNLSMSVNVSSRQLDSDTIISDIANSLEVSGLRPDKLVLEITESCLIDDLEQVIRRLEAIKSLGVKISLDDFGTGYSSLNWLSQLPIDVVKIDKTFVDRLGSLDDAIISAILNVAGTFNLQVVAEGIEEEEQSSLLMALGCQLAQGYLFAKPLPVTEAATLAVGVP
ncbi:MAG: putative bifunctional diguanylate cyclase/phosphodiesterase [Acidimicrobiales bacterium]